MNLKKILQNNLGIVFFVFVIIIIIVIGSKPSSFSFFKKELEEIKEDNKLKEKQILESYKIIEQNAIMIREQELYIDSINSINILLENKIIHKEKELKDIKNKYKKLSDDSLARLINSRL